MRRAFHQLGRPGDERAERAAEPLRQAERDRVERRADLGRRDAGRDRRVQQPGAVEVDVEAELARRRRRPRRALERPDAPAGALCVFSIDDDPRARMCMSLVSRTARGPGRARTARGRRDPRVTSPEWTAGPPSSESRMCEFSSASSSSPGSVRIAQRDLVRHRRRRQVDRVLLAEQLRAAPLELEDGRVLALLLVADLRVRHRLAHPGGLAACPSGGRSRVPDS